MTIERPWPGADLRYTLNGTVPDASSEQYSKPFKCENIGDLRMVTIGPDGRISLDVKGAALALIGQWNNKQLSGKGAVLSFDVTGSVNRPGNWRVEFVHKVGSAQLQIDEVALCQNGKVVSVDKHAAVIGATSANAGGASSYRIPV